jgi:hypothetical protein
MRLRPIGLLERFKPVVELLALSTHLLAQATGSDSGRAELTGSREIHLDYGPGLRADATVR